MTWNSIDTLPAILAMAQPAGPGQPNPPWYVSMFPLFLLLFAFYFAILRPQQKRQKALDTMMKGLKAGDRVTTTGGIIGIVITVRDRTVNIRSADTKLEVLKTAIAEVSGDTEATAASA